MSTLETKLRTTLIDRLRKEEITTPDEARLRRWCVQALNPQDLLITTVEQNRLIDAVVFSLIGLGPLEPLLRDDSISEIMVNGPHNIFIESQGKIQRTKHHFASEEQLRNVINRIVGPVGRRIDESQPLVDARLPDGSRVNAIIPPLSLTGTTLTIRKFPTKPFTLQDLKNHKSITKAQADFLKDAILQRKNILISGGTGSGKTSTLNALADQIPHTQRIITIEDAAEIRITHPHRIALESRPANLEGVGEISIRQLLKNALRMRPDRIVVGEIRSAEAIDMLQAMNTGHKGSLTTVHANAPLESLSRIETMILLGSQNLPLSAIRTQIAQGIDIILQQARLASGQRKIISITEVLPTLKKDEYQLRPIFSEKL